MKTINGVTWYSPDEREPDKLTPYQCYMGEGRHRVLYFWQGEWKWMHGTVSNLLSETPLLYCCLPIYEEEK